MDDEAALRRAITDALLRDSSVLECWVAVDALDAVPRARAYVVAGEWTRTEDLVRRLEVAVAGVSIGVVRLSGLPFRDDGRVDGSALGALVDSHRLAGLEREIAEAGHPGTRLAIVTVPAWKRAERGDPVVRSSAAYGAGRPAIVECPGADRPGVGPTLPAALRRAASGSPDRGLTMIGTNGRVTFSSYAELLRGAERAAGSLSRLVETGAPVVLQFPEHEQMFPAYWTVVLAGGAPVVAPVPDDYRQPSPALERLGPLLECLGHPVVLTSASRKPELASVATAVRVVAVEELESGVLGRPDPLDGDPAVMQLTSGSTGAPKCIVLSHENVMTTVLGNIVELDNTGDDVILTWAPMDHVGSLIHMIRAACLGCSAVVVRPDYVAADPLRWLDLLSAYRVTNTWAPSFAYKLVLERLRATAAEPRSWDLRCVRVMINAGEQVAVNVAREFCEALAPYGLDPRALIPAFGMAELGSGVTHSRTLDPASGRGIYSLDRAALAGGRAEPARTDDDNPLTLCGLGGPIPGAAVRVVDADGALRLEGTIGRVQFAGKNVMQGYYRNDVANAAVFQPGGWFDSGDLGFLAGGELVITGREKEVVIVRGNNLLCHDLEAAATVQGALPTLVAAVGITSSDAEECLAIFFVPDPNTGDEHGTAARIREAVAHKLGVVPDFVVAIPRAEFPRTPSGKIQRSELRRWFEAGKFADLAMTSPQAAPPSLLVRGDWLCDQLSRPSLDHGRRFLLVGSDASQLEAVSADLRARGRSARWELLAERVDVSVDAVDELVLLDSPSSHAAGADLLALQRAAVQPVLAVLRTLALGTAMPTRVTVVTRGSIATEPGQRSDPSRAILPGLLRSAARELGTVVRQVDVTDAADVATIATELTVTDRHDVVCLRLRGRMLRRFAYFDAVHDARGITAGAHCVVVGGLGGVGFVLCRWLLARYRARVLVLGRTPERDLDELRAERLRSLRQLGDVEYEAADVTDPRVLEAAVSRAERRRGTTADWLFQLAATATKRRLSELTWDDSAAELGAKVAGAVASSHLLESRPAATLVLFSSVMGTFGAALNAAYASACGFEEQLATAAAPGRVRCLSWSMWDKIGMSSDRSLRELAVRQGYVPLSADAALDALDAALRGGPPSLFIGVDLGSAALGVVARSSSFSQHLEVAIPDPGGAQLVRARARAELGLRTELRHAAELVDASVAEVTATEAKLTELWREVLGLATVPRDRGFFALGGNSLRAMLLTELINQTFELDLSPAVLSANPTLPTLANDVERARHGG